MKQKIKNILTNKELWIYTAITLIFFGILIKIQFAVDTYATFAFSLNEAITQFATLGRFVVVIACIVVKKLSLQPETIYMISYIASNICMIVSLYKIYNMVKEEVQTKNEIIKKIIPILIILNAFSIELYLYIEKGIMLFSVLMCICAVQDMKKWLEQKEGKYLITTFVYMLLANFSYQGVVGIFVAISLVYILKYSKNIKEFLVNNVAVALSYGIPAIIDYGLIKILYNYGRVSGNINLTESIKKVATNTWSMITNTYSILPKYFLILLITFIVAILIYQIVKQKENLKIKTINILKIVYIIVGTLFVTVAPQLLQNTESIWFVCRSTYSYAALYGILILYLFINYKVDMKIEYFIIAISIIFLIIQLYNFNKIEVDSYKVNQMDYEITNVICNKIAEYEEKTGIEVTKIAIYEDQNIGYTYNGVFATGDINIKAYLSDWSIKSIIRYYSGRVFNIVERDIEIETKFKERDWISFDTEQLIFDGDTLHLCKY